MPKSQLSWICVSGMHNDVLEGFRMSCGCISAVITRQNDAIFLLIFMLYFTVILFYFVNADKRLRHFCTNCHTHPTTTNNSATVGYFEKAVKTISNKQKKSKWREMLNVVAVLGSIITTIISLYFFVN